MSDNEKAMTLEQRVVQQIKGTALGVLVDEDALAQLAARALHEALFQPRRAPGAYHDQDSPAVAAARDIANAAIEKVADKVSAGMLADPAFKDALGKFLVNNLHEALIARLVSMVSTQFAVVARDSTEDLRQALRAELPQLMGTI